MKINEIAKDIEGVKPFHMLENEKNTPLLEEEKKLQKHFVDKHKETKTTKNTEIFK